MLKPLPSTRLLIMIAAVNIVGVFSPIIGQQNHAPAEKRSKSRASQRARPSQTVRTVEWYTFTSPDKDFTLMFPIKPERGEGGKGDLTLITEFGANTSDVHFSINYQDLDIAADDPFFNEFGPNYERLTARRMQQDGYKVVSSQRVARNISDEEKWQPTGNPEQYLNSMARSIIRNGRLYHLGCSSRWYNQEVNKSLCQQFFNSFRFTKSMF